MTGTSGKCLGGGGGGGGGLSALLSFHSIVLFVTIDALLMFFLFSGS